MDHGVKWGDHTSFVLRKYIQIAAQSLEKIREYTIENMVQSHVNYLHLRGDSYPTETE